MWVYKKNRSHEQSRSYFAILSFCQLSYRVMNVHNFQHKLLRITIILLVRFLWYMYGSDIDVILLTSVPIENPRRGLPLGAGVSKIGHEGFKGA